MPRINAIDPAAATGKAKALLDAVQKALGVTPNMMRTLANSPAALEAYLNFSKSIGGASLGAARLEQIALTVANVNSCGYCAAAHTALGKRAGLNDDELAASLTAVSDDPKVESALQFAKTVVERRGFVSDRDLASVRAAGYGDAEIIEIVAAVALNLFTNYVNHVARTEIDFPVVAVAEPVGV